MYDSLTVFVASLTAANVLMTTVVDDVVAVVVVVVIWDPEITLFFLIMRKNINVQDFNQHIFLQLWFFL